MRGIATIVAMICVVGIYMIFANAITSPELTARANAQAQARVAMEQAQAQARMVQAQQNGQTARAWAQTWETWGVYGLPAAGVAVVFGLGGWAVVEWQRERTKRNHDTENYTTQRHMISAKRDVALAYIGLCGDPNAARGQLNGVDGVFLPGVGEFVPLDVCAQELRTMPQRLLTVDGRL